jgi:DNA-binding GntR family transcriptional regulator
MVSLADGVYEILTDAIISGDLPPETLLSEVSLAKKIGVSRTPVHDALRQLGKDGLVEHTTGKRARVAKFTGDDVFEIFEMRKLLEGAAAELAAGRMDDRHLVPLHEEAEKMQKTLDAPDWLPNWHTFDEQFHLAIAQGSGNRRLTIDIARYRLLHRGFNRLAQHDTSALHRSLQEHILILQALSSRNATDAKRAMTEHIGAWQTYFVKYFAS